MIANQARNFCVGANLGEIGMAAYQGQHDQVVAAVQGLQGVLMGFRYAPRPVVVAPHGQTLGGGAEIVLHGDRVVAALEMVAGVAEAGLPPAHVGLHAGPVIFQEGDYYGQTVNVASRIAEYARPGEVLVAEATAPPWTPLFATAAAVVTDVGGVLSHCAVVAREYQIPAVVGTGTATTTIRDGQLLEVDGDEGVVRILAE